MSENGHVPPRAAIPLKWSGRLINHAEGGVTYRAICIAGYPDGDREVCTVEFQVWEGGADMLRQCAPTAMNLAVQIATKQISGLSLVK